MQRTTQSAFDGDKLDGPTNPLVTPMLTDMYQLTMAYAYWKNGRHNDDASFDLFFRKNPFDGEFTIFAGLEEAIRLIKSFSFDESDIAYLKTVMVGCEDGFFEYLSNLDCSAIKVYCIPEGTVVFPKEPLIRVEGPLGVGQLLETPLLNLVNYPSLICTNAARMRQAAGKDKVLLEFGLRRAQGPDGGFSASRYSYLGGFDGSSNVLAGKLLGMSIKGTHAHAYVQSYRSLNEVSSVELHGTNILDSVKNVRNLLGGPYLQTHEGELAAFISYAYAFPDNFLALVDTYDTLGSGILNFVLVGTAVILAGREEGREYKPTGVRLDSGDLAHLSKESRKLFYQARDTMATIPAFKGVAPWLNHVFIFASNSINEAVLYSLEDQHHEVDGFGIGTNLVTCQAQPALGCVYKLVDIDHSPRIKISEDIGKVVIPGRKSVYRLYNTTTTAAAAANDNDKDDKDSSSAPVLDLICGFDEPPPRPLERVLCRHPLDSHKRAYVVPTRVVPLLHLVWDDGAVVPNRLGCSGSSTGSSAGSSAGAAASSGAVGGEALPASISAPMSASLPSMDKVRGYIAQQLGELREDHRRPINPTPYKVSLSGPLYDYMHELWQSEAPIKEIH